MKEEIREYYQSELNKRSVRMLTIKKDFKTKEEVDKYMKLLDILQETMDKEFKEDEVNGNKV